MPKQTNEATIETAEGVVCEDCQGARFQIHERGMITRRADGVLIVDYDELALQCMSCHHVMTLPVKGVIEYQA